MIIFKPNLDINIERTEIYKNGRYVICEVLIDGEKFVFVNIYLGGSKHRKIVQRLT